EAAYEDETLAFQTRVLADGGTVGDLDFVDAVFALAKTDGWYSRLRLFTGEEVGYKAASGALGTNYDASDYDNDFVQATTAAKPTLTQSADFNGKNVGVYDGTDDGMTAPAIAAIS